MSTKLCGCGCGADMEGSPWNFKRGHKPRKVGGGGSTVQPPKRQTVEKGPTLAVPLASQSLYFDELWVGLSYDLRRKALRSLLEWDGVPNLA